MFWMIGNSIRWFIWLITRSIQSIYLHKPYLELAVSTGTKKNVVWINLLFEKFLNFMSKISFRKTALKHEIRCLIESILHFWFYTINGEIWIFFRQLREGKECFKPRNMIIMPGYCVAGTVGAKVIGGMKQIDMDGRTVSHFCFSPQYEGQKFKSSIQIPLRGSDYLESSVRETGNRHIN